MKSAHDIGCAARESKKCDCKAGKERRITAHAAKTLKRQRKKIAEKTGLHYDETLVKVTVAPDGLRVEWHWDTKIEANVGQVIRV